MMQTLSLTARFITALCVCLMGLSAWAEGRAQVTFLAGDAAKAAIVDESVEPYFSLLCLHEMEVKSGVKLEGDSLDAQRDTLKTHYAKHVRDFTDLEKEMLAEVIDSVHRALAKDYPGFVDYPWSLIKTTDAVEQGLPHTRSKSIILPAGFLTQATLAYRADKDQAMLFLVNLMVHEQIHVVQRLKPEPFKMFYTQVWDLEHVESIAYDDWLNDRQLINPDGVDTRWVQNIGTADEPRYIQPNIIIQRFDDRASRMPQDFKQVAVELKRGDDGTWRPVTNEQGETVVLPLARVREYMAHYGGSQNVYHPNESFADLFAIAVLHDRFIPPDAIDEQQRAAINKTLDPVRELMRQAFGKVKPQAD